MGEIIVIIASALLPVVLLLWYTWSKDSEKEPISQLVMAIIFGVVICIPIDIMEKKMYAGLFGVEGYPIDLAGTTALAFIAAALPEELFKFIALWLIVRKNKYFDEHYDGIVYAVFVGLGFAAAENILYVLGSEEWVTVAFSRALLAVPGHYAFAIFMGYYYSVYSFVDKSLKNAFCILFVPVLAHGIYDAIAMSSSVDPSIGELSYFALVYFCVKMHKVARTKVLALIKKDES